jgi:type IV pilus assembly protein PilW
MRFTIHRPRGFSLIELLIGMVIAMMGLAAVGSMMMTFSKKRSSVTQTMGAQDNGVMALYRLEKDLAQAGYGLMPLQRCTSISDGANAFVPSPVIIADGGTGPDALQISYITSNSGLFGAERVDAGGFTLTVASAVTDPDSTATTVSTFPVRATVGFIPRNLTATPAEQGDRVVLAPTDTQGTITCMLTRLISVGTASVGVAGKTNGYVGNLGSFASNLYAINGTTLQLTEFAATANNLVDDIIFLKAQYGVAGSASSTTVATWQSTTPTDIKTVVAIRIGVVARSALQEKEVIDAPATLSVLPATTGVTTVASPATGLCATDGTTHEVKCTVPDTRFRYRAYSTMIPLRNVMWTRCPAARPDCSPW